MVAPPVTNMKKKPQGHYPPDFGLNLKVETEIPSPSRRQPPVARGPLSRVQTAAAPASLSKGSCTVARPAIASVCIRSSMAFFTACESSRRIRARVILLIACVVVASAPSPCAATVFTGSISSSDPPSAVLVARFNFREYTESKYSVQADSVKGFFALFDDETSMLQHLEKGLSSRSGEDCMSYLMDGKGVGPYRALPPAQLEHGWNERIIGNYCRDWFFVFFNCKASLEVSSYRIETSTDGGSQLPCGKENLPVLLAVFTALCFAATALLMQKHGRDIFDHHKGCFLAVSGCAISGVACFLMGLHYFRMRSDGVGSSAANFVGRILLQGMQLALLAHALRFSASLSLRRIWLIAAQSRDAKVALCLAGVAYVFFFIASLTADSSESVIANAQPLNTFGVVLTVCQLIFAVAATALHRRALLLDNGDIYFLKWFGLALALPWLWCLPLGTLLCLTVGSKDQLVAVYAVQLSLSTVYASAAAIFTVNHVPDDDDPQLFEEPRIFDDGL